MASCCAVVSPDGSIEFVPSLDAHGFVLDVLQEPVHSLSIRAHGVTLYYSMAAFFCSEVNEFASGLANLLIKGDACLVHEQRQPLVDCLLQSKQLRISQTDALGGVDAAAAMMYPQVACANCSAGSACPDPPCDHLPGGADSSCCVLKRQRSMQHIAAANSARQRILRSMSATGAAGASLSSTPLAHRHASSDGSSSSRSDARVPPNSSYSRSAPSSSDFLSRPPAAATASGGRLPPTGSRHSNSNRRMPPATPDTSTNDCPVCEESSSSIPISNNSNSSVLLPFFESHSRRSGGSSGEEEPSSQAAPRLTQQQQPLSAAASLQQCSNSTHTAHAGLRNGASTPAAAFDDAGSAAGVSAVQGRDGGGGGDTTTPDAAMLINDDAIVVDGNDSAHQQQQGLGSDVSAAAGAAAAAASVTTVWTDLPVEVIAQVARFVGNTVSGVMPIYSTCRSWHQAVLEDDQLLMGLAFKLDTSAPTRNSCSSLFNRRNASRQQHPLLLERASKLGNVSALVVRARLLDAAGLPEEGMRCWRKAAKCGHLEGQLLFGLALYRGTAGVAPDAEDAHLWLSKALKQVVAAKQPATNTTTAGSGSSGGSSGAGANSGAGSSGGGGSSANDDSTPAPPVAAQKRLPARRAAVEGLHSRVLTQAGLVLGYLSFDGEGTRQDRQEAVRCFKLAANAGCREAQQVIGWIYNTGQY